MNKKEKLIVFLAFLVLLIPIIINEVSNRDKRMLINEAKSVMKTINKMHISDSKEILINDGYTINDKKYNVHGTGIIIINDTKTFFLEQNDMCVMKLDYSDKLMFQNNKCPIYRMYNGIPFHVIESGSGVYKDGDEYYYKGSELDNYVMYNDEIYNIISFSDKGIKLISTYSLNEKGSVNDIYKKYEKEGNYTFPQESLSLDNGIDINTVDKYNSSTGILTLSEYLRSLPNGYYVEKDIITIRKPSFLSKQMKIGVDNYYIGLNGNIYGGKDNNYFKVIVLPNSYIAKSGTGMKSDPYILKEA